LNLPIVARGDALLAAKKAIGLEIVVMLETKQEDVQEVASIAE